MFFVMTDTVVGKLTYSRRVGAPTQSLFTASKIAIEKRGYILNESRDLMGQAHSPDLPGYIGSINKAPVDTRINIGSGEDCYA
jgi:hypothetical protein